MKPKLRVFFTDFWKDFNCNENYFIDTLKKNYEIIIDGKNPELLIFSYLGKEFLNYPKCIKIFYTGENIRPSYWESDYSLSFDYPTYGGRNFRLPLYVLYGANEALLKPKNGREILAEKSKFCNFVVSNPICKKRNEFFQLLNKVKHVDSGGKLYNNIGYLIENKLDFIKDYRFSIAFENSSFEGYTTEKIFEPMKVNSIPIYWGNSLIKKDFNAKSFINVHDFSTLQECVNYIVSLDDNTAELEKILNEPWFHNNQIPEYFEQDNLLSFFDHILKVEADFNPNSFQQAIRRAKGNISYESKVWIKETKLFIDKVSRFYHKLR